MRAALRTILSLLVVTAFVAVGVVLGILFSLPGGSLGAAAGGGHGVVGNAHQLAVVWVGGAFGLALAVTVVRGVWRNHMLSCWFGAGSVSALAILLACLIPIWHYPVLFEVAALLVPVVCAGFLYAESKSNPQASIRTGA